MKRLSSPRRGRVVTQESALPLFASAKRRQEHQKVGTKVLDRPTDAPEFISSGLRSLDKILQGGFPVGELSLVAARPKVGATSLLMGMGLDALKASKKISGKTKLIGVTTLTSLDNKSLKQIGYNKNLKKLVIHQAKVAAKANLDALVCSAHEVKDVRKNFKKEIFFFLDLYPTTDM